MRGEDGCANELAAWDARRVIRMRKLLILCTALFCVSLTASAQDSTAAFDAGDSEAAAAAPAPASFIPADRDPWQIGVGFQYLHFSVLGQKFHNFAYQAGVTRYFTNHFGIEGTVLAGFGSVSPSITAKSLFLGGGPHVSLRNTEHLEPWVHVLVGWERFRFTETNVLGNNSHAAFLAGGGLDYKIHGGRLFWRVQGDYFGTNMGSPGFSNDYFFGTGLVLNF
jgi:hypothetical protein